MKKYSQFLYSHIFKNNNLIIPLLQKSVICFLSVGAIFALIFFPITTNAATAITARIGTTDLPTVGVTAINTDTPIIHLSWTPEAGDDLYRIQLRNSNTFQNLYNPAFETGNDSFNLNTSSSNTLGETTLREGETYTIRIRVRNNGSWRPDINVATFTIDTTSPTVRIQGGATTFWQNNSVQFNSNDLSVTCQDSSGCDTQSYTMLLSDDNPGSCSTDYNSYQPLSTIIQHTWLCIAAKDTAGNAGFSTPVEIKIDTTPPSAETTYETQWITSEDGAVVIDTVASDPLSGLSSEPNSCQLQIGSARLNTTPTNFVWGSPIDIACQQNTVVPFDFSAEHHSNGNAYKFRYRATDNAGNQSNYAENTAAIKTDYTEPQITNLQASYDNTSGLLLSWQTTDPESGIQNNAYCISNHPTTCQGAEVINYTPGPSQDGWSSLGTSSLPTNLPQLLEGRYYFHVRSTNNAKSSAIAHSSPVLIDTQGPAIGFAQESGANVEFGPVQQDFLQFDWGVDSTPASRRWGYFAAEEICPNSASDERYSHSGSDSRYQSITLDSPNNNSKYICLYAEDTLGNSSLARSEYPLNIDDSGPELEFIDGVSATPTRSDTITVNWSDAITKKWEYSETPDCNNLTYSHDVSINGNIPTQEDETKSTKYICLYAEDALGNINTLTSPHPLTIDRTPPEVSFQDDVEEGPHVFDRVLPLWGDDAIITKWTYSQSNTCSTNSNDYQEFIDGHTNLDQADDTNNTKYICLYVADTAGNTNQIASKHPLNIDTNGPDLTFIESVDQGPVFEDTIIANWGTSEQNSRRWDYFSSPECPNDINSYRYTPSSNSANIHQTSEDNNTKYICLYGALGGISRTLPSSHPIFIDRAAPIITINTPAPIIYTDTLPQLQVSFTETNSFTASYQVNGIAPTNCQTPLEKSLPIEDLTGIVAPLLPDNTNYTIFVCAIDQAGNSSIVQSVSFTLNLPILVTSEQKCQNWQGIWTPVSASSSTSQNEGKCAIPLTEDNFSGPDFSTFGMICPEFWMTSGALGGGTIESNKNPCRYDAQNPLDMNTFHIDQPIWAIQNFTYSNGTYQHKSVPTHGARLQDGQKVIEECRSDSSSPSYPETIFPLQGTRAGDFCVPLGQKLHPELQYTRLATEAYFTACDALQENCGCNLIPQGNFVPLGLWSGYDGSNYSDPGIMKALYSSSFPEEDRTDRSIVSSFFPQKIAHCSQRSFVLCMQGAIDASSLANGNNSFYGYDSTQNTEICRVEQDGKREIYRWNGTSWTQEGGGIGWKKDPDNPTSWIECQGATTDSNGNLVLNDEGSSECCGGDSWKKWHAQGSNGICFDPAQYSCEITLKEYGFQDLLAFDYVQSNTFSSRPTPHSLPKYQSQHCVLPCSYALDYSEDIFSGFVNSPPDSIIAAREEEAPYSLLWKWKSFGRLAIGYENTTPKENLSLSSISGSCDWECIDGYEFDGYSCVSTIPEIPVSTQTGTNTGIDPEETPDSPFHPQSNLKEGAFNAMYLKQNYPQSTQLSNYWNSSNDYFLSPAKAPLSNDGFRIEFQVKEEYMEYVNTSSGQDKLLYWSIEGRNVDGDTITLSAYEGSDTSSACYDETQLTATTPSSGGYLCYSHFIDNTVTLINPPGIDSQDNSVKRISEFLQNVEYPTLRLHYITPIYDIFDREIPLMYRLLVEDNQSGVSTLPGGKSAIQTVAKVSGLNRAMEAKVTQEKVLPIINYIFFGQ